MRVQWMQSWMSVALRRMCVEPVNWYFLSDSEKSWRWQKKKKISGYLFMRRYKYVRERLSTNRTTVRQRDGRRRTVKRPWRLCRCENLQQLRWQATVGGCCHWDTRNRERERERAATEGSSYSGDIWETLWSARYIFVYLFNGFSVVFFFQFLMLEFSLQRKHAGDWLRQMWFVQFWEEEWRTTAVTRCAGVTETCLIKPQWCD